MLDAYRAAFAEAEKDSDGEVRKKCRSQLRVPVVMASMNYHKERMALDLKLVRAKAARWFFDRASIGLSEFFDSDGTPLPISEITDDQLDALDGELVMGPKGLTVGKTVDSGQR